MDRKYQDGDVAGFLMWTIYLGKKIVWNKDILWESNLEMNADERTHKC